MPIGDKEVLPSVLIEIHKSGSPPKLAVTRSSQSRGIGHIIELPVVVVVKRVVVFGKVRDQDIHPAIVIIVTDRNPHGRLRPAIAAHRTTRLHTDLFKSAIAPVMPQ